jgi:hypothetical protein
MRQPVIMDIIALKAAVREITILKCDILECKALK